jgi:lauroyl/myristoyl acyltransferase
MLRKIFIFAFQKVYAYITELIIRYKHVDIEDDIVEFIRRTLKNDADQAINIYKASISELSKFSASYASIGWHSDATLQDKLERINVIGKEILEHEIKSNNSIIVLSLHIGDFYEGFLRVAGMVPINRDFKLIKINQSSRKEENLHKRIANIIQGSIGSIRVTDKNAGYEMLRTLKNNGVIAMMNDIPYSEISKTWVNYFDKYCPMQDSPARLAIATNATIIPVVCFKDSANQINVEFGVPILGHGETRNDKIQSIVQKIAIFYETMIRKYPEQYCHWGSLRYVVEQGK